MGMTREYSSGDDGQRRLALSALIQQRLGATAEREKQRARLVNAIILAQICITAAATVGYIGPESELPHVIIGAAALVIYLMALGTNAVMRRENAAAYILVVGGMLAVGAQTVGLALVPSPTMAAQASLLFIALIFETSLLFTPEATLLVAVLATICAAFAILFALSQQAIVDTPSEYLLLVYTLGLQALAGIIAWVLAVYISESSLERQRGEEGRFSQARLEALMGQVDSRSREMQDHLGGLQSAITRALGGETPARAEVGDGALAPLAESLNILLERFEQLVSADRERARIVAATFPMLDALSRMADAPTPTPSSLPIITNTSLDSVQLMLAQAQANITARMGKVQMLTGQMLGVLGNSQAPLDKVTETVQEAYRVAGLLISASDDMLSTTTKQVTTLQRMRRELSALLPSEVTGSPSEPARAPGGLETLTSEDLRGLGVGAGETGLTDVFEAIQPGEDVELPEGHTPLTMPMRELDPDQPREGGDGEADDSQAATPASASSRPAPGAVPDELVGLWTLLVQIDAEMSALDAAVARLSREASAQSRSLRSADVSIAYLRQTVSALKGSAEALQQLAGAGFPMPPVPEGYSTPGTRPLTPEDRLTVVPEPPLPFQPSQPLSAPQSETPPPLEAISEQATEPPAGELPDETPTPGSLRMADLLNFDGDFSQLEDGDQS
jgi:hypothetical protein